MKKIPRKNVYTKPAGGHIKALRRLAAISQETMAHALCVTVSTVNRWENNKTAPSRIAWELIRRFAAEHGEEAWDTLPPEQSTEPVSGFRFGASHA